jgi:6-pyruvoyltetrahydropterin/6-carboxytetrahydropterin synthase
MIRHVFEAAHRLPHLGGACASIHGHSWGVAVTVTAPAVAADGTVTEFGALKRAVRSWLDSHLDNGAMLGVADPLLGAFTADGSKTFRFGAGLDASEGEQQACDLPWPTVEAVAILIGRVAGSLLETIPRADGSAVSEVTVAETRTNTASWRSGGTW